VNQRLVSRDRTFAPDSPRDRNVRDHMHPMHRDGQSDRNALLPGVTFARRSSAPFKITGASDSLGDSATHSDRTH
jgi:hypothetical protein